MYRKVTLFFILTIVTFSVTADMVLAVELEKGVKPDKSTFITTVYRPKHATTRQLDLLIRDLDLIDRKRGETFSSTSNASTIFLRVVNEARAKEVTKVLEMADTPAKLSSRDELEQTNVRLRVRTILASAKKQDKAQGQPLKPEITKILSQIFGHDSYEDLGSNYVIARTGRSSSIEFFTKTDLNLELVYKVVARDDGRLDMEITIHSEFPIVKDDGRIVGAKGKLNTVVIAEHGKEFILGNTQVGGGRALIYAITVDKEK